MILVRFLAVIWMFCQKCMDRQEFVEREGRLVCGKCGSAPPAWKP